MLNVYCVFKSNGQSLENEAKLIYKMGINDFNVGAGDPDLGGSHGVPPPAQHILSQLDCLGHQNMVLVEPLDEVVIVDGSGVSPGAALGVGPDGQVRLLRLQL